MPKGVEHLADGADALNTATVETPLMPKGVEHTFAPVLSPWAVAVWKLL